jgi:hypothetical protein
MAYRNEAQRKSKKVVNKKADKIVKPKVIAVPLVSKDRHRRQGERGMVRS